MTTPAGVDPAATGGSTDGRIRGLSAVLLAQFLLRVGSAAGALVIGSYFVELAGNGIQVGSLLLGVLSGLTYLAELVIAPVVGAASDRRGRRVFLVIAPLLAALGIMITPGATLADAAPPLVLVVVVVATARLIEGAGAAMAAPTTLGLLADATDGQPRRRGRLSSVYELSSSGGIAVGAVLGPVLYALAGLWAFALLAILYAAAAVLIFAFVTEPSRPQRPPARSVRDRLAVFASSPAADLPAGLGGRERDPRHLGHRADHLRPGR